MPSSANIRIARNTVVIYIRMAVTILVGLITSRLVLQALGASDVGIYSAVGSTVALIAFITGALTATTVRFMNFEMGRADGDTNRMFKICHVIHIGGALVLFLLLESIGLWYIHHHLNVPPGKEADAMFVFQVSTVVACLGIANVPFQSLFNVHERFATVAVVDIVNALVKLGLVIGLLYWKGNGLRLYAVLMSVTTWICFVVYRWLCRRNWPDIIRWKFVRERKAYREVLVFNNYNLLSSASMIARSQGSNMLINAFFGTTVNAAYFYAGTVQNYVNQFIANFDTAAAPQITQNIGAGNADRPRGARLPHLHPPVPPAVLPAVERTGLHPEPLAGRQDPGRDGADVPVDPAGRRRLGHLGRPRPAHQRLRPRQVVQDRIQRPVPPVPCRRLAAVPGRFPRLHDHHLLRGGGPPEPRHPAPPAAFPVRFQDWQVPERSLLAARCRGRRPHRLARTLPPPSAGKRLGENRRRRPYRLRVARLPQVFSDSALLKARYFQVFHRPLDLKHPQTFNEKIQWMKIYDRDPRYTVLSDKYAVKEEVAGIIGREHLIPTLGVWDRFDQIDFQSLPEQFVLKCTHDSGGLVICRDRKELDMDAARAKIEAAGGSVA